MIAGNRLQTNDAHIQRFIVMNQRSSLFWYSNENDTEEKKVAAAEKKKYETALETRYKKCKEPWTPAPTKHPCSKKGIKLQELWRQESVFFPCLACTGGSWRSSKHKTSLLRSVFNYFTLSTLHNLCGSPLHVQGLCRYTTHYSPPLSYMYCYCSSWSYI